MTAANQGLHAEKADAALDRLIEAGSALWAQAVELVMTQPVLGWALVCAGLLIFGNLIRYRLPMLGGLLRFLGNLGLIVALIVALLGVLDLRRFGITAALPEAILRHLPQAAQPQVVEGKVTRVPLAEDGHFWVRASIDGTPRRFLVDTGATLTTISPQTAQDAGLRIARDGPRIELRTANGNATGRIVVIRELKIGNAVARNIEAVVAPGLGETNVLGMNFLTRLKGWRVEGHVMVLEPHHPANAETSQAGTDEVG